MKRFSDPFQWRQLTLPGQFLLAGAVVMLGAMLLVGNWVAQRIEGSVVQNSAAAAALYVESFISPLSQELSETGTLSPPARQALEEIFRGTALGERIVSYKIWLTDGTIVYASDPALRGQTFERSDELIRATAGEVAASFEELTDLENEAEAALGIPLLEVYSPVRQVWTGEVIGVAEFYERAEELDADIRSARRTSWLVVGGAFLSSGLLLFGIVQAGGRTIRQQRAELVAQLSETRRISRQNELLRKRAVSASSRSTAQTERAMRRIGFDLHDGPAQYLALASLRLESALQGTSASSGDVEQVRQSLSQSLQELRLIARGLSLPDLDRIGLHELIDRAIKDHERQSDMQIGKEQGAGAEPALNYAQKLCVYRFLQETLSNAARHSGVTEAQVDIGLNGTDLTVTVSDRGVGFDVAAGRSARADGGLGLFGLVDRAESIGGAVTIDSAPDTGTRITLRLPKEDPTQ